VNRRDAIKAVAVTSSSLALSACVGRQRVQQRPIFVTRPQFFARPIIAPDREIRTTVGLRPFRIPGFRVEPEKVGQKTLVHNYGHGGAGITLSWGTAQLACDLARASGEKRAAVLGCGVVGLATARTLQQRGYDVTIYTRDVPPETTSNRSGGFWLPYSVFEPGQESPAFRDQFARAVEVSFTAFQLLVGAEYGVRWLPTYVASNHAAEPNSEFGANSPLLRYLPELRELHPDEHPFAQQYVRSFRAMLVDPHAYLRAQVRDFRLAGGKVVIMEIADPSQLVFVPETLIMNCTGLGAASIFNDAQMTPIRGQLTVMLPQPEVDYAVLAGELYMFPRQDGIVLGGTYVRGDWSTTPDVEAKRRIIAGHAQLFQPLAQEPHYR
jgi:D-amino-acid oxidase